MQVDYKNSEFWLKPLWVVYGPKSFPTIICVTLHSAEQSGVVIWGYSVYKNSPGFRTLGMRFETFQSKYDILLFTDNKFEAVDFIQNLVTPKISAIKKLKNIKQNLIY